MLDSEPNCRQSKPWTTRPHVSVIGSCTLVFQARKLTPWKSISRGNSLITFVFYPTYQLSTTESYKFFIHFTIYPQWATEQNNNNNQKYPWSAKAGWLGKSPHTHATTQAHARQNTRTDKEITPSQLAKTFKNNHIILERFINLYIPKRTPGKLVQQGLNQGMTTSLNDRV